MTTAASGTTSLPHVDHVGSLIRPARLMEAWRSCEAGTVSEEELRAIQDECIREVVAVQQEIGLQVVTDGEFRRAAWSRGLLSAVDGFAMERSELTFRDGLGTTNQAPAPVVSGKIRRKRRIVADDYGFLKGVTSGIAKVTMPTPSHIHFGHFGRCIRDDAYTDMDEFWHDLVQVYRMEIADLAAAGCTLLQLDEVPLALCCDETNRAVAEAHGEDPDALVDTYMDLLNAAIADRPETMRILLHLCRGNQQGLWMGDGGYAPIAERLFNDVNVDAYLMEYDTPRAGDFQPLAALPRGKMAYLGIVSTKDPTVEDADELKRRIEEASGYAPIEQLGICPQCGFASAALSTFNITENPATAEIQQRKLERLVEVADDVWR